MSILLVYGFVVANQVFSKNTKFAESEVFVYVPTGASYADVKKIISSYIENIDRFETVAEKRNYPENVKSGRFLKMV